MKMSRAEIHSTILEYLDLIENGKEDAEENLQVLEMILDKLALASHFIEYKFDKTDYPDEPRKNYAQLRELISKRFPNFGFYNIPSAVTDKVGEAEIYTGDALDDVTDIGIDMHEVAWRWENNSAEDALFHFEILYDSHWGNHLRNLQFYVHHLKNRL